jgi:hypothetical protein
MARPPETWSRTLNASVTRSGSFHGSTVTIVPSLIRWVWPASQDRTMGVCEVSW